MEADKLEKELSMFKDPGKWPHWPLLPVKRRTDGTPDTGFVMERNMSGQAEATVYLGNIFSIKKNEDIVAADKEEYEDLAALVNDGWIVD